MTVSGTSKVILLVVAVGILHSSGAAPTSGKTSGNHDSEPRFTNAVSNLALVYEDNFVQLNCFAENYNEIRWFKDGKPFPDWNYMAWLSGWVELRFNNQSLMIARAPKQANGVYSCVVSDGETKISQNITLRVMDTPYNGPPLILHGNQCKNVSANIGDDVTFYCEVYVGSNNFMANAYWSVEDKDGHMTPTFALDGTGLQIRSEISPKDDVLGCSLHITNVTSAQYGQYVLSASTGGQRTKAVLELKEVIGILQKGRSDSVTLVNKIPLGPRKSGKRPRQKKRKQNRRRNRQKESKKEGNLNKTIN